jgi:hypothetical protein
MRPKFKKLIGTVATLIWIPIYALLVTSIAVRVLPHGSALTTFVFYALAGTLWIVPVGLMLPWMYREPPSSADGSV